MLTMQPYLCWQPNDDEGMPDVWVHQVSAGNKAVAARG